MTTPLSVYLPFNRELLGADFEPAKRGAGPPETRECISAPPNDSSSTSSRVAILTSGGPARNTCAWFLTITT